MRIVDDAKELKLMEKAFYKVFRNNDPFGEAFIDQIRDRLILCPVYSYFLNRSQFEAVKYSAMAVGDTDFYISEVEGDVSSFTVIEDKKFYQPLNLECSVETDYDEYAKMPFILENAIFSKNGNWGVLISHEDHAIVGGKRDFMQTFKEAYSKWPEDLRKFQDM